MNLPPQVDKDTQSVYALVLAAGTASRFGSTKQTVEYAGIPMVRRAVAVANEVCGENTVLVTGHDRQSVAAACEPLHGREANNENYRDGIGSSIACGVSAVCAKASAIVILLADQPRVTAGHVQQLIDNWCGAGNEIVATSFAATRGPPVLFGPACFDALCELTGDTGAKKLFSDDRFMLKTISFEPAVFDVDKPEDVKRS